MEIINEIMAIYETLTEENKKQFAEYLRRLLQAQ